MFIHIIYNSIHIRENDFAFCREKVPLVVFGSGMVGKDQVKLKGLRVGVTGKLYEALKKRERRGDLIVVGIDEYLTSQVCSKCQQRTLNGLEGVRGHSVLVCQNCRTIWQRDVNASVNMMTICKSIWNGQGRPQAYKRN